MEKKIERVKRQLNKSINHFNHIVPQELANAELERITSLEKELGDLQRKQREELGIRE